MITVIATVECVPGHRDDFVSEFHKIVPTVLQETGCIQYGPTVDVITEIEAQDLNPNRVTIVEKWETVKTLEAHLVAQHMQAYRPKVANFVASIELRVLQSA